MALTLQLKNEQVNQMFTRLITHDRPRVFSPYSDLFRQIFKNETGCKLVVTRKDRFFVKFKDEAQAVQFKLTWL